MARIGSNRRTRIRRRTAEVVMGGGSIAMSFVDHSLVTRLSIQSAVAAAIWWTAAVIHRGRHLLRLPCCCWHVYLHLLHHCHRLYPMTRCHTTRSLRFASFRATLLLAPTTIHPHPPQISCMLITIMATLQRSPRLSHLMPLSLGIHRRRRLASRAEISFAGLWSSRAYCSPPCGLPSSSEDASRPQYIR